MIRGFKKISKEQYKKDGLDIEYYDEYSLPKRATKGSAGYDFCVLKDYVIKPGEVVKIPTGIKVYMPEDELLYIVIRSSLGCKYNMRLCNQLGIIDADYYDNADNEGHIWICLKNEGNIDVKLNRGDRFVQGIFATFKLVDDDTTILNRTGGFGSTNEGGE